MSALRTLASADLGRALALALLAACAWWGSLVAGGFSFDDHEVLEGNPVVGGTAPWSAAWTRDYWDHRGGAGHYRPSATLSLRLDRALYGDAPTGYHATNVALHALCVFLAALLAAQVSRPSGPPNVPSEPARAGTEDGPDTYDERQIRWPVFGVALFALHPVLADSVAWISGRTSMLSMAPVLAGAVAVGELSSRRGALAAVGILAVSAAALFLGLAGKEEAWLFALVLPLCAWRHSHTGAFLAALGAVGGTAALLALRAVALGSPLPSAPHAPLADAALPTRLAVAGRALVEALRLSVLPVGYPPNYHGSELVDPARPDVLRSVLGLAAYACAALGALLVCARSRLRSVAAISLLLACAAWLPFLQIVPAGEVFAPRFLYVPLLLAIPFVDTLLRASLPTRGRALVVASLLAIGVVAAWHRAGVYASRASYRLAVLASEPNNAPSWNDLGLAFEADGKPDAARRAWERAIDIDPRYSRPWSNLGRVFAERGELQRAEEALVRAAELGPRNPIAHAGLGALYLRTDRPAQAARHYEHALELAPGLVPALRGAAQARWQLDEHERARELLERALDRDPGDARSLELKERWSK